MKLRLHEVKNKVPKEFTDPVVTKIDERDDNGKKTGKKTDQISIPTRIHWLMETDIEGNVKYLAPITQEQFLSVPTKNLEG